MGSNYVLAALYSTYKTLKIHFDIKHINLLNNFFETCCNKFLHSYGVGFANRKNYLKFNKMQTRLLSQFRNSNFFNNSEIYLDSGGFQISIGLLNEKEGDELLKLYYDFLIQQEENYEKAFILDYPPGPGCKIFENFDDVYRKNILSYQKALQLPKNVTDKMIYVHHFRTPKIWEISNKILDSCDEMFLRFNYFATGGIVANLRGDFDIPCLMYILPLVVLLNRCKKFNRKKLNFHILGGAHFRDILFYELIKIHVKKFHNIDLEITYDSSGVFKNFFIGRRTFILIENEFLIDSIRVDTNSLMKKYGNKTYEEIFIESVNNCILKFGFEKLNLNSIYDKKTNKFFDEMRVPFLLFALYIYKVVEDYCKVIAKNSYYLYENDEIQIFHKMCLEELKKLSGGKITRKQYFKTYRLGPSLKILENLDEELCENLVNNYLIKDEFHSLSYNESGIVRF